MRKSLLLATCIFSEALGLEIGNDPNGGGAVDGWASIMVVDEQSIYTNISDEDELVTPTGFDFLVGENRGRVTPFLVKVNGDNNFSVVAIGRTRVSGVDYSSSGVFEFAFENTTGGLIKLAPGETLAAGMTNANADGSGNEGSVIPFRGGNEIWLTGGGQSSQTGSLTPGSAPNPGGSVLTLNRTYAFSIDVDITSLNQAPTDIVLDGGSPIAGMPIGTSLGTLITSDPDQGDSHTFEFTDNPGGRFSIEEDQLKTAELTGDVGTSTMLRIKAIDSEGNEFEKDFTMIVESQAPPTDLSLDASSVSNLVLPGSPVAAISTIDVNGADQFVYALVEGDGDSDNGLFSVVGNVLVLEGVIPNHQIQVTFRLRTTDLGGASAERSFALPVVAPDILINEFAASNSSFLDEDGDSSDWIEFLNNGSSCVDLGGWSLTDDLDDSLKWVFPPTVIAPGEVLVVFASQKNRTVSGGELHTNFSLSSNGETLNLFAPGGVTIVDQILSPPNQFLNIAYGLDSMQSNLGFLEPSPGGRNGETFDLVNDKVFFDKIRGAYESPFSLILEGPSVGEIRYTIDGSAPTASSSLYEGPILVSPPISGSTSGVRTIRAAVFGGAALRQKVATHTYVFAGSVVDQTTLRSSIKKAPAYSGLMEDALLAHPIVSITRSGGLPGGSESISSLEFFDPATPADQFQVDCGIQVVGGHSVGSAKNNFRLYFRSQYGESRLRHPLFDGHPFTNEAADSFDRLNLRSGSHDSFFWLANPGNPPNSGGAIKGDAQYLRNRWMSDMLFQMGQPSLRGRWVQVFINGNYHGQYHLLEHPNSDYMADYLGGSSNDFEFTNGANSSKTGSDGWPAVWAQVKAAANGTAEEASSWIDLENLADYMILNFYAGNPWDWNPNQNWWTAGPNQPNESGWKFFSWDADIIFQDPGANVLGKNVPDGVFTRLISDPDFAIIFRDRLYKHCFHGGVLSPRSAQSVFDARASEIELSIIAETARWQGGASNPPWDRDDEWQSELDRMRNAFFPTRCDTMMNQVRARGWYPIEAPEFGQRGGAVAAGHQASLSSSSGSIYYTTDGSDPREEGGGISSSALLYSEGSLVIGSPVYVRTRSKDGANWSAINEASFVISGTVPADVTNLAITEIHYHPATPSPSEVAAGFSDQDDFEFIEVSNFSTNVVDLTDVSFIDGVSFTFPPSTTLNPGSSLLVVKNVPAFLMRNPGLELAIAGSYVDGLSNGGERLTLVAANDSIIADFTYNDNLPWPNEADGDGFSMVLRSTSHSPTDPFAWRSSSTLGGNPAASDRIPFPVNGDLIAYALSRSVPEISFTSSGKTEVTYLVNLAADDADLTLEYSDDLDSWIEAIDYEIDDRDNLANGTMTVEFQSTEVDPSPHKFYRLRVIVE